MAHHRSSHKQEKDFRGLYIGAAIGVAATQVCNYCLALPQPPPPPPEKTAEALDAEKVKILMDRESWQLPFFYSLYYVGTYTDPPETMQDILKLWRYKQKDGRKTVMGNNKRCQKYN